jgi:hypothetical protein
MGFWRNKSINYGFGGISHSRLDPPKDELIAL